jgi:hypothetical protein
MQAKLVSRGRQARAPRTPSSRDQEIYAKYNFEGRRQTELAADYGLSQNRISEIIRRVTAWKSSVDSAHQESPQDHARLLRQVQDERLNLICREAIRHFYDSQTTITRKSGTRGDKPFEERTERTTSGNLQCLKVLLAATRELRQLAESDPPPTHQPTAYDREQIMEEELVRLYEEAIAEGKVEPTENPAARIDRWLDSLLGETLPTTDPLISVPGSSPGPQHSEAPASAAPPTNIPSTTIPEESPKLHSQNTFNAKSIPAEKTRNHQYPDIPPPLTDNPPNPPQASPKQRYEEKLARLDAARSKGLPIMIDFDPDEGPTPPDDYVAYGTLLEAEPGRH